MRGCLSIVLLSVFLAASAFASPKDCRQEYASLESKTTQAVDNYENWLQDHVTKVVNFHKEELANYNKWKENFKQAASDKNLSELKRLAKIFSEDTRKTYRFKRNSARDLKKASKRYDNFLERLRKLAGRIARRCP